MARCGVRNPAKAGWSSGKLHRLESGLTHTERAGPLGQLDRDVPRPVAVDSRTDHEGGTRATAQTVRDGPQRPVVAEELARATRRSSIASVSASQSSSGIETNVGPHGRCIAVW